MWGRGKGGERDREGQREDRRGDRRGYSIYRKYSRYSLFLP